ncbi:MAG: sigma-54 dependent transcriptional regulator [Nitrospirota bacterium]
MAKERILIVDDERDIADLIEEFLGEEGYQPIACNNAKDAVTLLRRQRPDLVLLDVRLPDGNGLDLLKQFFGPELGGNRVIVLTGYGTKDDALEAVDNGAYDYLTKPIVLDKLKVIVRNCLQFHELTAEVEELTSAAVKPFRLRDLVGTSQQMQQLIEKMKQVAPFEVPVLITGENGTGKDLVAKAIHGLSERRKGPFVPIDCSALPETLIEAELFGYEKGAFTGAVQGKVGRLEQAHGGTLFIDELGNIPLHIQPKLLRVLQSKSVERLGGRGAVTVDVRIVSATNENLDALVADGRFRMDLYHRLNTVILTVPPLAKRKGDIPLLAHYFLLLAARSYKKPVRGISPAAMELLESYPWPGNVRELENCMQASVILADRVVEPEHLPTQIREHAEIKSAPREGRGGRSLSEIRRKAVEAAEREAILLTLKETGWNKSEAARRLCVDYKTLYTKILKYGIHMPTQS